MRIDESTKVMAPLSKAPTGDAVTRKARDHFAALLRGVFDRGLYAPDTKPPAEPRWTAAKVSAELGDPDGRPAVSHVAIGAWLSGKSVPKQTNFEILLRRFYGPPKTPSLRKEREEFRKAWEAADAEAAAAEKVRRKSRLKKPVAATVLPTVRCVGRDRDIESLVQKLTGDSRRALVLIGPGGIGKTTLADKVFVNGTVASHFLSRRWRVELANAFDGGAFQAELVRSFGFQPGPDQFSRSLSALQTRLRKTPGLLLLDNLDSPWNDDPRSVREILRLLSGVEGLSLLATMRGSSLPDTLDWKSYEVSPLGKKAARDLFLVYAKELGGDALLEGMLAKLHGIPLLIRNLALRARYYPDLRELSEEWKAAGVDTATDDDADAERHVSQAHSVAFSWRSRRLPDPSRRLFRFLGQLPAGMANADRQALFEADAGMAAEQLIAHGLAEWRSASRIDLHPLIRDVAHRRYPVDPSDTETWWSYYLDLLGNNAWLLRLAVAKQARARLLPEVPNIEASIRGAIANGNPQRVGPVAEGYGSLLTSAGLGNVRALHEAAAACRRDGDTVAAADCLVAAANVEFAQNRPDAARVGLREAIKLAVAAPDYVSVARGVRGMTNSNQWLEPDEARQSYVDAINLSRWASDDPGMADNLTAWADFDGPRDPDKARQGYTAALVIYDRLRDLLGRANCVFGLAKLEHYALKSERAREGFLAALSIYRQLGDSRGEAMCLTFLADLDLPEKPEMAIRGYLDATRIYRQLGDALGIAACLVGTANIDRTDDPEGARQNYIKAMAIYHSYRDWQGIANCLLLLAQLEKPGTSEIALSYLENAFTLYDLLRLDGGKAECLFELARNAEAEGDIESACKSYGEAAELFRKLGNTERIAWIASKQS